MVAPGAACCDHSGRTRNVYAESSLMKRSRRPSPAAPLPAEALTVPQLDLFPVKPLVERLAPKAVAGAGTGVTAVLRVRLSPQSGVHLVFLDRHGWYCEAHGAACAAVVPAREALGPAQGTSATRETTERRSATREHADREHANHEDTNHEGAHHYGVTRGRTSRGAENHERGKHEPRPKQRRPA